MITKLKLALLCYCRETCKERGFAVPLALGFGLTLVLIGAAMVMRSQSSQIMVSAQTASAKSLSAAEIGVNRLQTLIDDSRILGVYCSQASSAVTHPVSTVDACDTGTTWSNMTSTTLKKTEACKPDAYFTSVLGQINNAGAWQTIDNSNSNNSQYRFISYTYVPDDATKPNEPPGKGILILEGRVNSQSSNEATSRLQVTIPIQKNLSSIEVPGMWLKEGDSGSQNQIDGDVFLNDCNGNPTQVRVTAGHEASYTSMTFPTLPDIPTTNIKDLGNLTKDTPILTFPQAGDPYITQELPKVGTTTNETETIKVYQYKVNSILLNGNAVLKINPASSNPNQERVRVIFYLAGDLTKSEILHSCTGKTNCTPSDFQIFGYGTQVGASKLICTIGNEILEAFILAPDYTGGVAGSGGGAGGIKGSVWLKNWSAGLKDLPNADTTYAKCGSSTSNIVVSQTANWGDLGLTPVNVPPQLKPIESWDKKSIR